MKFSNGDIFEGKLDEEHNTFIKGKFFHENLILDIYEGKIVNMIHILIIDSQESDNNKKKYKKYYRLENNFVLNINYQKLNNINIDNNLLENLDVILFVCGKCDNYDYIKKYESLYNKIIEIKSENLTFGILTYEECLNNQELKSKTNNFKDLIKGFVEEIDEQFNSELKETLKNIKDKYLKHFKNKVTVSNEGTYIGELNDGKRNGFGVLLNNGEVIYIGNWENDETAGKGYFRNLFYDAYLEGEFKNNELITGEKVTFGGFIYNGNFYKDDICEGVYKYFDFLEYSGSLKGKFLYGKMKIKNGNEYEGKFENVFSNQSDYDILFNKEGEGKIIYSNGDIYEGKWVNFRKNGKGKIITNDGIIYESEWNEDKEKTNGIIIFENGDIFINEMELNEDDEEDIIELNVDVKNFKIEKKIKYIEEYLAKANDIENMEIYDDELGSVKYDINEINKIWRIGQNISEYIKEINKIIFFKDFLISSFYQNDNNKIIISKSIEKLIKIIDYLRKYIIFKYKKTIMYNDKQKIDIIEENFNNFNDIEYFKGIINDIGIDLDKKLEKTKGIMKYKNGDLYQGYMENNSREGKGIMIYQNGDIYEGYWKNNEKDGKGIMKYKNGEIINEYWKNGEKMKDESEYNKNIIENEININNKDENKELLEENELNELIKNIDLTNQYCQIEDHKKLIIGICIDKNCKIENKLICQKCIFKMHKQHEIEDIEEYNKKIKEYFLNEQKNIKGLNINNINKENDLKNKSLLKINDLKKNINELFDKNVDLFINYSFDNFIKLSKNNFNDKITLLKQNYPIDNLNKEIKISNLINSLDNINQNQILENEIIDLLDKKLKKIKSEIEETISANLNDKLS